jgi:SAM-dependent methyltransferase
LYQLIDEIQIFLVVCEGEGRMKICISCDAKFNNSGWRCPVCGFTPPSLEGFLCFSPELARVNDGFRAESFGDLFVLEDQNFWFISRNRLIVLILHKYFPQARSFLEIGCGTGYVLSGIQKTCPDLTLCGSEIFVNGLEFTAQRLDNVELFQMDARGIPFDSEFDVIGAFDVLEHISEDELVLSEVFKSLKPGGGIILTVPQHLFMWSVTDEYACHVRRYTAKELSTKVERAGFQVERMTSFVSLLFPLMLMSRFLSKIQQDKFDPSGELKVNPVLNKSMEYISSFERLLIKAGASFPFGGSLLLVGRKV